MRWDEDKNIDSIKLKISDLQKLIKHYYGQLNTEDISEETINDINEELKRLNKQVVELQKELRENYRNHFSKTVQQGKNSEVF